MRRSKRGRLNDTQKGIPSKANIKAADNKYIASGSWKCPSPTGAHHWLIGSDKTWRCKHCGQVKEAECY